MKNKPKKFLQQPIYPGGKKALDEFVRANMRYPEEALKNNVQGSVTVKFDIDAYGKITDAAVTHGIGYGCDEEALRLVKLLRYQKKIYRGLHVVFHQIISIHFRLRALQYSHHNRNWLFNTSIQKPSRQRQKIQHFHIQ